MNKNCFTEDNKIFKKRKSAPYNVRKPIAQVMTDKTNNYELFSPSSILVVSPPLTIGTDLPACIWYGPIEWPLRFRQHLTG